jgi:hypothetical protein
VALRSAQAVEAEAEAHQRESAVATFLPAVAVAVAHRLESVVALKTESLVVGGPR